MRTSSIRHPKFSRFLRIYDWQLEACEGNACAAALLSLFEGWYNHRLEQVEIARQENAVAEQHGLAPRKSAESLVLFLKDEQLESGIMGLYKRDTIRAALSYLERRKFVEVVPNPNPKFKFDRTRHFIFHAREINKWLDGYVLRQEQKFRDAKTRTSSPKNPDSTQKNRRAIQENDDQENVSRSNERGARASVKVFMPAEFKVLDDEKRAVAIEVWGRAAKFLSVEQEFTKFVADAESKSLKYANWLSAWRKRCVLALQYATRDGLVKLDELDGAPERKPTLAERRQQSKSEVTKK